MYQLVNITKTYPHRDTLIHALDGINLEIPAKSFVIINGGSGSGKTTLLMTLGGLLKPNQGTLRYGSANIYQMNHTRLAEYRNAVVGFVLQTFNLVPYLTALENVMVPMMIGQSNLKACRDTAQQLLHRMGLQDRSGFLPSELSVGQQQRVAIARAMTNNPEVILADEPTGNLDQRLTDDILKILRELNEIDGKTVIMVTHNPEISFNGVVRLRITNGRLDS